MTKKKEKTLVERLEQVSVDLMVACDCDGRGCTMCMGADVVEEAIIVMRNTEVITNAYFKET